jgi:hypothetical protein
VFRAFSRVPSVALAAFLLTTVASPSLLADPTAGQTSSPVASSLRPSGAVSQDGTILFTWAVDGDSTETPYTIFPDGTNLNQLDVRDGCCATLSPDGSRFTVFATAPDGVLVTTAIVGMDGSSFDLIPLPAGTRNMGASAWDTDQELLLQVWDDTDHSKDGVYIADPAHLEAARRLTSGNDEAITASRDGAHIAFVRAPSDSDLGDLYVINADGTGERRVNPDGTQVHGGIGWGPKITWSPDGSQLVFAAIDADGCNCDLWSVDANSGDAVKLLSTPGWITDVQFSPDGKLLATDAAPVSGGDNQILVLDPDGTNVRILTPQPGVSSWSARWSPDGTRLVYQAMSGISSWSTADNSQSDLWSVGLDGAAPVRLTHRPGHIDWLGWSKWTPPTETGTPESSESHGATP